VGFEVGGSVDDGDGGTGGSGGSDGAGGNGDSNGDETPDGGLMVGDTLVPYWQVAMGVGVAALLVYGVSRRGR
jgi:hypothetical protein